MINTVGQAPSLLRFIYTGPPNAPKHNKTQKRPQRTPELVGTTGSLTCRLALKISNFCYSRVNRLKNKERKNPLLLKKQHTCVHTHSPEPFNKQCFWQKRSFLLLHAHLAHCLSASARLQSSPRHSARSPGQVECSRGIDTSAPRALFSGV